MSDESAYVDEDGQEVGYEAMLETGEVGLIDSRTGEILAVTDQESGEVTQLEPGSFYIEAEAEPAYEDPRLAGLQAQYDQLEQRIDQPQEVLHTHRAEALSEPDIQARWGLEQGILEGPGGFGRPLTQREIVQLGQESAEAGHYSLIQAAEARADRGEALPDVDVAHPGRAHEARMQLAAELIEERSDQPRDPFTGQRPRQAEQYDRSTSAGRQAQLEDALNGYDVRDRDVDTSYPAAETNWWDEQEELT